VGWTNSGEWLEYSVRVTKSGTYDIQVYVASPDGSRIHFKLDGEDITGSIVIPATGGWQTWDTSTRTGVVFDAGVHYLQLYEEDGGFNIDKIAFLFKSPAAPDMNQNDKDAFQVYPNPAYSSIKIEYQAATSAPVTCEIYDLQGRLVHSMNEVSDSGVNQMEIDVRNFTSGNYYIKLMRQNTIQTNKLLVIK
jgi:hypothetical protein